jgi:uncharacterized ion transporter superfamily protein YfcC
VRLSLPHPLVLLLGGIALAAALTWWLPAGAFDRRDDATTGRTLIVPGTYHRVAPSPVGPVAAAVSVPRGIVAASEVVLVVLLVGGAWGLVDRLGVLGRVVGAVASVFDGRSLVAIPILSLFFVAMGALENMQEEIIPLVPVLLLLGRRLGVDAVTVVAISAGSAMVGSAFGPTNPFQAGIAMKLAELPLLSGAAVRLWTLAGATIVWIAWTMRHAVKTQTENVSVTLADESPLSSRDIVILLFMLVPMTAYVYGAVRLDWGFNELSAGFFMGGIAAGLVGRLGVEGTLDAYLDSMKALLPAAIMVGVARSISLVLEDGHVIDTMLAGLSDPLSHTSSTAAALLMVPVHGLIHVAVSSVSGHAVLTMPLLVPLSDLLGVSRQATVMAYQTGAGLTELLTPTNGSLMAILLAAGVTFQRWFRFAAVGTLLAALVGIAGILAF